MCVCVCVCVCVLSVMAISGACGRMGSAVISSNYWSTRSVAYSMVRLTHFSARQVEFMGMRFILWKTLFPWLICTSFSRMGMQFQVNIVHIIAQILHYPRENIFACSGIGGT